MSGQSSVYEVQNLTKIYPRGNITANDDLSFTIERGEIFGLLGPNGAGKTTLIKQLLGLIPPTRGEIRLFGTDVVANAEVVPYYVSSMAQRPTALADLKVREALEITGRLRMLEPAAARREADARMEELELGDLMHRIIGRLSQGQQRLVSLALSLVAGLPVMVLDEPTNDLDPRHRRRLWNRLRELNERHGTTIILVTHNVVEAERVLQRVGIINRGRIMALGRVAELKRRVDDRIRLEITPRTEADGEAVDRMLEGSVPGTVLHREEGRLVLLSDHDDGAQAVRAALSRLDLRLLSDFRILSPSLEDVYLQLGGGERLDVSEASD